MTKQCFKCKETKSLSEFYRHPMMGDGYLGKCKTCTKRDVAERVAKLEKNPEWLAKERERHRLKQTRYRELGLAKPTTKEVKKKWVNSNPHKRRAQTLATRLQKKGGLKKPDKCNRCNVETSNLEKHHEDYSKPLSVEWLCTKCHGMTRHKTGPIAR